MHVLGARIRVFSMYRPPPALAGPSSIDPGLVAYRPGALRLTSHFLRWALRRPWKTTVNVTRAVRCGSQTMLRGAWSAGWIASGLERAGARHVHAHFGHDPASAGLA